MEKRVEQWLQTLAVLRFTFLGARGVAIIAAWGGARTYIATVHPPPLTSGNYGLSQTSLGAQEGQNFYWGLATPF